MYIEMFLPLKIDRDKKAKKNIIFSIYCPFVLLSPAKNDTWQSTIIAITLMTICMAEWREDYQTW